MDTPSLAQEVTELHADMCSALAEPKRILILYALAEGRQNVSDLANLIGISQPAASRHLKILRERGLAQPVRQGASVVYHLTDERLIEALDLLRAVLRDRIHYRASLIDTVANENTA
jgi:ArsR family transcriptional regulator